MGSISQRGDKFLAQVRVKQHGVIVFSESRTLDSKAEAAAWIDRVERKVRTDGPTLSAVRRITVGELIQRYLEHLRTLRPLGRSTIQNHEYMATQFWDVPITGLSAKRIIDFATRRRRQDGVTPATVQANLSALSASMQSAQFLLGSPIDCNAVTEAIRFLRQSGVVAKSRQIQRLLADEEEVALMEQFERRRNHHSTKIDMVPIFRLALALPRRAGELMRLRWDDIDQRRRTILVRDVKHPTRKEGNHQTVPLLGQAWDILQSVPRCDELVFPHQLASVLTAFEVTRNRIAETGMPGIRDLRFHDLRHTGITRLFRLGLEIPQVAVMSGHTNWVQLKRYTHLDAEDLHTAYAQKLRQAERHRNDLED